MIKKEYLLFFFLCVIMFIVIWGDLMNINDFDYVLPQELIAQTPLEKRDSSRLLVMDKVSGVLGNDEGV